MDIHTHRKCTEELLDNNIYFIRANIQSEISPGTIVAGEMTHLISVSVLALAIRRELGIHFRVTLLSPVTTVINRILHYFSLSPTCLPIDNTTDREGGAGNIQPRHQFVTQIIFCYSPRRSHCRLTPFPLQL